MATATDYFLSLPGIAGLSQRSQILLAAFYLRKTGQVEFSRAELAAVFRDAGLPIPRLDVRLPQLCAGKKPAVIRTEPGRYSLSLFGLQEVEKYFEAPTPHAEPPPTLLASALEALKRLVGHLATDAERLFLAEAVACVEVSAKRAAVVMVWLLTMDHLFRLVLKQHLADFNAALARRPDARGLVIKAKDDFGRLRDEKTFIEILASANIVSKDVRKILDEKLGFRNSCAHPADIVIPDTKVIAAIEDLVHNVILKYPL